MKTKQVELLETKADGAGTFTALASVFGNEDLQGDRVLPGAFKKSIAALKDKNRVLPIVSSHNHDDPRFTIGTAQPDSIVETDKGLEISGQLDLDNPIAAQVHRLFKSGAWTGWSFGYEVVKESKGKDGVNELEELGLIEAGPCLKGANPEAQLLEAKSAADAVQVKERQEGLSDDDVKRIAAEIHRLSAENPPTPDDTETDTEKAYVKQTNAPWDGSPARFTDAQYARSCVLDRNDCGDVGQMSAKMRYSLPIREPSGAVNSNAVHAAASRIGQVSACADAISKAKGRLRSAYSELGEQAPDSIKLSPTEAKGEADGHIEVPWVKETEDALPDAAFLHIEQGGHLDEGGKTLPRRLRRWPYKDRKGIIDEPHLKAALEQVPAAHDLSPDTRERLQARAKHVLNIEDEVSTWLKERAVTAKPRDPLKDQLAKDRLDDLRR